MMLGGVPTVNALVLETVPPSVEIVISPEVAPAGTVAVICVSLTTVNVAIIKGTNSTEIVPVNPLPRIVTDVPAGPVAGEKLAIAGGGPATAKPGGKVEALPAGVVTVIGPDVAPAGTVAVICVSLMAVNETAAMLLN